MQIAGRDTTLGDEEIDEAGAQWKLQPAGDRRTAENLTDASPPGKPAQIL